MFKLPNEVKDAIKEYKNSLEDLLGARINPSRFAGIRVAWGTYSHRGGKIFMNRIRIPAGQLNAVQLKAIAYAAATFGKGIAHITTRQDMQIHNVKIEDTIKVIEYLKDYELSPRGGGGNTVRNITACALSGICRDEVFDVRNYAIALTEHLLRQDTSFNLPRKLKIAFSGCSQDCSGCLINDVGLLAQEKNKQKGFKVFAAGGLGAEPAIGLLLEEFIPAQDLGYTVQAIKNVFYKKGDRRNKHHNRLRFLVKDLGPDTFKGLYLEEVKFLRENEYIDLRKIDLPEPKPCKGEIPVVADEEFKKFAEYNFYAQKEEGLVSVELRVPRGDISADSLGKLAALEPEFGAIEYRTSQSQNIFICNVKKSDTHKLFLKIKEILAGFLYPSTLLDVVCCKGALTCNLGLCNSPGLTEEVEKTIAENFLGKPVFRKLNIKINGCPNACGQHPIGLIALHGAARRVENRPLPFYKLLLAGRKALENTRLAKDTGILLPAKNVPLFLKDFIARIGKEINETTDIYKYMDEKAGALAKETAKDYTYVPAYSENKDFYIDWGKSEEFSLDGLGPGECGKGILDMIEADLTDAKNCLESAKNKNFSVAELKKALFFAARALLVVKGSDPKTEEPAFRDFSEKFIKEGLADPRFSGLSEVYSALSGALSVKQKEEKFLYVKDFFEHINALYKNMDSALNFPKQKSDALKEAEEKISVLDLKGVRCPLNYVQAKLYLENIKAGEVVEFCLDEGEPIQNVPLSLKNDGQEIMEIKKMDGYYILKVKKLA